VTTQAHYEIEKREATEATVRVTVEPAAFQDELDAVYRRHAREIRIPGFRKGHVPRNVLESRFGRDSFIAETQEELERRHLPEALVDLDLRPVSRPQLEVASFAEAEPFVFTASFSVLPKVELPAYRGREVEVPAAPPTTNEDVEQALAEVQSQFATLAEKDGDVISDGDIVHVREGEREWDTRADGEHPAMKALVGVRVGDDVEIDIEKPDGGRLRTTLAVLGLREIVLPEIDDELAKDAGFESLDALKSDVEVKIGAAREGRYRELVETAALDKVVEDAAIPLPEPFLEDLEAEEIEGIEASLAEQGRPMSFGDYVAERGGTEDEARAQLRASIERRLRRELVLRQIATAEKIAVDDEALEEIAREEAKGIDEDPLRFVARLKAEDRWGDYRASKVNERVFAVLRETAVVSEPSESRIIDPTKDDGRQGLVIDPTKEGGGA